MITRLKLFLTTCLAVVISAAFSLWAPYLHKSVLRNYVGSKVVVITQKNLSQTPRQGGGSGFHVLAPSGKTYIMTNRHVCHDTPTGTLWVVVQGETTDHEVKVLYKSDFADLCLLEPIVGITGLKVGSEPEDGQTIAYIGHPKLQPRTLQIGEALGYDTISIFVGEITKNGPKCDTKDSRIEITPMSRRGAKVGSVLTEDFPLKTEKIGKTIKICVNNNTALLTTLMIYGGASGSPMIDIFGNLVAVVYAAPENGGWGYGVTLNDVKQVLKGR